ncbi:hypothetical protein Rsub_08738 [Raphidocelis subcapitata]|uniref:Short-chain dehydrogenase n=1 Tax=Raphidocelis subcapitata TaxID=307507 RepID=A0A2V0PE73_9CHLO|nr:hypothetical protein Rsub_08738 [Raphidocelis subcapitata]|eukprot:GBF96193.1 hypothetical protein Rsub_08738 [Raphidocelis subcapitata]
MESKLRRCASRTRAPVVIVTGCSAGGLGHELAASFHAAGARVFACARRAEAMAGLPDGVSRLVFDVTDEEGCSEAVTRAAGQSGGRIDFLVNSAGIAEPGALTEAPLARLKAAVATNLIAPVCLVQCALPYMAAPSGSCRGGGGVVVNINSIYGRVMSPFHGAYCASKHALRVVSDTLRLELAPYGVAVVDVALGFTATAMLGKGSACMAAGRPRAGPLARAHAAAERGQAALSALASPARGVAGAVVAAVMRPGGPPAELYLGAGAWAAWAASWAPRWAVHWGYGLALGLLPPATWLPAPLARLAAAAGLLGGGGPASGGGGGGGGGWGGAAGRTARVAAVKGSM